MELRSEQFDPMNEL